MDGKRFNSLSAAAHAITSASWNGPRFFGLRSSRRLKQLASHNQALSHLYAQIDRRRSGSVRSKTSPLIGKFFANEQRLTPSHTQKNGRRYRYYISCANKIDETAEQKRWRLKATDVELSISEIVMQWLASPAAVSDVSKQCLTAAEAQLVQNALREYSQRLEATEPDDRTLLIAPFIERVDISEKCITIQILPKNILDSELSINGLKSNCRITSPLQLKRRGAELRLVLGDMRSNREPDISAIKLLARAHHWRKQWVEGAGEDFTVIASNDGVDQSTASKQLRLAFLAPDVVEALIKGAAPIDLTAERLRRLSSLPADWQEQCQLLGFD